MEIVNQEIIEEEICDGLAQVDESLTIDNLDYSLDRTTRVLSINLTVRNNDDETVEINEEMR